jgi:hypothetical protein
VDTEDMEVRMKAEREEHSTSCDSDADVLARSAELAIAQATHDAAIKRVAGLKAIVDPPDVVTEIKTPMLQKFGGRVLEILHIDYRHERAVPDPVDAAEAGALLPEAERVEILMRRPLKAAQRALDAAIVAARAKRIPIADARVGEKVVALYRALAAARDANEALHGEVIMCNALLGVRHYDEGELVWAELRDEPEVRTELVMVPGRESHLTVRRRRPLIAGFLK